jgi:hypothetical protein
VITENGKLRTGSFVYLGLKILEVEISNQRSKNETKQNVISKITQTPLLSLIKKEPRPARGQ